MSPWSLFWVWLHILAAAVWIGSMVFLALVLAPALRTERFASIRRDVFRATESRLRWLGWSTLGVLIVTGLANVEARVSWSQWASQELWTSTWGRLLGVKVVLVAALLVLNLVHEGLLRGGSSEFRAAPCVTARREKLASWAGRLLLLVSLPILGLGVLLVRGPI